MPARKKQTGKGVAGDIARFIKNQKLISKGLGFIPHPAAQVASQVADLIGLGKKAKRRSQAGKGPLRSPGIVQMGGGIFSDLGGGIGNIFGGLGSGLGSVAGGLFGRGKRKAVRPRAIHI